jgi:hypothetical protein
MPTPKKPNLPFVDDDAKAAEPDELQDDRNDTTETAPLQVDHHQPGLSDVDDEATVAVPPIAPPHPTAPSIPRPNRR